MARALEVDSESLDALQTLASLRLSQNRAPDACTVIEQVVQRVQHLRSLARARTVLEDLAGTPAPPELDDCPELEFCVSTVKLLVECAAVKPSLAGLALELGTDLLQEDDENLELWYILGVAALGRDPPDLEGARIHLETARDLMDTMMQEAVAEAPSSDRDRVLAAFPYAQQYELVLEHLRLLEQLEGEKAGEGVQATVEADDEEEEEWSDCDDEEARSDDEGMAIGTV